MFTCPVCKKEESFLSCSELSQHIKYHKNTGTSFHYPLVCAQNNCYREYSSLQIFLRHVANAHADNFCTERVDSRPVHDNLSTSFESPNSPIPSPLPQETCSSNFDYSSLIDTLLIELLQPLNIPHSYVEFVIKSFEQYLLAIRGNLTRNQENLLEEIAKATAALSAVNTVYKFTSRLYSNRKFIPPTQTCLGSRWESSRSCDGAVVNKRVDEKSYYVSILKTLSSLLDNPVIARAVVDESFEPSTQGEYSCFKDGWTFKNHPLFSDRSKLSLRLQLFYDGMGTTNPLRGHSTNHNVGIFYFTVDNLPAHLQTSSPNIFLFALCYTVDLKKYGFNPHSKGIYERFKHT
jgi:hypothetical protein